MVYPLIAAEVALNGKVGWGERQALDRNEADVERHQRRECWSFENQASLWIRAAGLVVGDVFCSRGLAIKSEAAYAASAIGRRKTVA
jgi:hypothetical protein